MQVARTEAPDRPRLRIIEEQRPEQDCTRCRMMRTCWNRSLDPQAVVINLLVCRVSRNISRDRAARTLVQMLKPKFTQVARRMHVPTPVAELVDDMAAVAIESFMTKYRMGELMHPLRWLFGPKGTITRWSKRYVDRTLRDSRFIYRYDDAHDSAETMDGVHGFTERIMQLNFSASGRLIRSGPAGAAYVPNEYDEHADLSARSQRALDIVDDGVTLPVAEFRVVKFCLSNARDGTAPIAGLHQALARRTGLARAVVTRIYGQACRRIMEASGEAQAYLLRRGLTFPRSAEGRRRNKFLLLPQNESMGADEIADMLELRRRNIPVQDIAWIFGVSEDFIYRLTRKFKGMLREQIVEICNS